MSIETLTQIKLPPWAVASFGLWITSPRISHIFSATTIFIYCIGMLWTCTQKEVFVKHKSMRANSLSYFCIIIRCLSKLHGSLWRTRFTSALSSKIKRTLCSPWFCTLNPFRARYRGLKVLKMASMFKALLVKNFATMMNSFVLRSPVRQHPGPSFSDKVRWLQFEVKSSMVERCDE